jgi:hypothetical protein
MAPHAFAEVLDELIYRAYTRVRGMGVRMVRPRHSEVLDHADSLVDDVGSPEHMLLRHFDLTYRDLLGRPPTPWSDPGTVSGEIDAK